MCSITMSQTSAARFRSALDFELVVKKSVPRRTGFARLDGMALFIRRGMRGGGAIRACALISLGCFAAGSINAEPLKKAKVTQVINDVNLLPEQAAPKHATVNDEVHDGTAVRTGTESRSELTFTDQTIARLGANTIFNFNEGTRSMDLGGGAMLLRVPKNAGGAKISTAAVTAAITGTTVMMQYDPKGFAKFIVLEGTACLSLKSSPNNCVSVKAGQLLAVKVNPPPTSLPAPIDVDLSRLIDTSALLSNDFGPLPSLDLIAKSVAQQEQIKSEASAAEGNTRSSSSEILLAALSEMTTAIDQRTAVEDLSSPTPTPANTPTPPPSSPTPPPNTPTPPPTTPTPPPNTPTPPPTTPTPPPNTPTPPPTTPTPPPNTPTPPPNTPTPPPSPTPQKFGTPPVITSSNPYHITSGTVITTDPTIMTAGVVDEGRIYRDPQTDGSRSQWLFGSTSSFDMTGGFENGPDVASLFNQFAAFKFQNLQLAGNPTIDLSNGGRTVLALVGVTGLTTAAPGGAVTFDGIAALLLATQNGSINLGPEVSFQGIDRVFIYARGANSNLVIGSDISAPNDLRLLSQGTVQINGALSTLNFSSFSGGDFLGGAGTVTAGGIYINSLGDLTFNASQFSPGAFSNISLSLAAANLVAINVQSSTAVFENAGSVDVRGTTITLAGANPTLLTFNSAATPVFQAGAGGIQASTVGFHGNNISLLSAGDINIYDFDSGGTLSGTISAAGAFSGVADFFPGNLSAGTSITIGGQILASEITAGTTIDVSGRLSGFTVTAGGNINAGSIAVITLFSPTGILNVGGGIRPLVVSPGGAAKQHTFTISTINAPAGLDFSGNQFNGIDGNFSGGALTINADTLLFGANAGIAFANFDGADGFGFDGASPDGRGGNGGTFMVNAEGDIVVETSISATTGLSDPDTASGTFSGAGGTVALDSSNGAVRVTGSIQVSSNDNPDTSDPVRRSASGGNITLRSGATTGTAISIGSTARLSSLLDNGAPGAGGIITIRADALGSNVSSIEIDNSDGGIVANRGAVDIRHFGDSGIITLTNAEIFGDVVKIGALGRDGTLTIGGGLISAGTLLRLYAGGSNGSILFNTNVTLDSEATATVIAAKMVKIANGVIVTINGPDPANIFTDLANYAGSGGNGSTTGMFGGSGANTFPFADAPPFDSTAGAVVVAYTSAPNGNWSDPNVWNPMVVPNNGNGGRNYDAVINGGTLTQDITSGVVIEQLFMRGGTLLLSNPLRLNSGLQFSGGAIDNGILMVDGTSAQSAVMTVSNTTINNFGDYDLTIASGNVFSGGGSVFNNFGNLTKSGSGVVNLNIPLVNSGDVSVNGGTLRLTNGGTIGGAFASASGAVLELATDYTLASGTQISGPGIFQLANGTTTTLVGTLTNNGTLNFNNTGNGIDLRLNGSVTVVGNGVINLDNVSNNRVFANTAGDRLTLGSGITLQGSGNLGLGQTTFTNNGIITANQSNALVLQPGGGTGDFTNGAGGVLRANGGTLQLLGGIFSNNGTIEALNGSQVQFTNGASVVGGTLASTGSSIHSLGSTLTNVTNRGDFVLDNGSTTTLVGTLTNNGTLTFANIGNGVDLRLSGPVSLAGTGLVSLDDVSNNRIFANTAGDRLTIGSGQTIQGAGNLGLGQTTFTNNGTITANLTNALVLQPGGGTGDFTNASSGIVQATNGARLQLLAGNFVNNNIVRAQDGSFVELRDGVNVSGSGSFLTVGTGLISVVNSATLNDLIFSGSLSLANGSTTTLFGTLTNNGTLTFANIGNGVDLRLSGPVSLAGTGLISLADVSNNRIFANTAGDRLTIGSGQTIQGAGNLGLGQTTFTNNGTIIANLTNALVLQPGGGSGDFTNNTSGILEATSGATLQLLGGTLINNNVVRAQDGSRVELRDGVNVSGNGSFLTVGTGLISVVNSASLSDLSYVGSLSLANGSTTTLVGTLTNNGTLTFANIGNGVDLRLSGPVSLAGTGLVSLDDVSNNRIFANTAGDRLTIGSGQTIQGAGNLGLGQTTFTNNGTITANLTNALVLQPGGGTGDFTNASSGIVQATNGARLQLLAGNFVNNNIVRAQDGSFVELRDGVNVSGSGSFLTVGTGLISVVNSATLNDLIFSGSLSLANGSTTTLFGTLTNNGTLTFANIGNGVDLRLSGPVSLAGTGLISLADVSNNRIFANTAGDRLTIGSGQTIQGAGNLGLGQTTFTNNGTIIANLTNALVLQPGGGSGDFTNAAGGIVEARNGATLQLLGNFVNNNIVRAQDGSFVELRDGVNVSGSGSFLTVGTGLISVVNSATLNDVIFSGKLNLANGSTTSLLGTLTNNGTLTFANIGNGVDLRLSGSVALAGTGLVSLADVSNNRIFANTAGDRLTIGNGETIQGAGNLGLGQTTFTNNGTIIANLTNALILQPGGSTADFTNNASGILRADGGTLQLNGGVFNNSGTIAALNGGTLRFDAAVNSSGLVDVGNASLTAAGTYTQSAGTFRLAGGSVQSNNALSFQGGLVDTYGTINAAIMNNAILRPGLGGNGLNVTGNVSLLSASQLTFQLGGLTQGSQYGYLNVNGTVSLGGQLILSFVNGFQNSVTASNTFTLLTSSNAFIGNFTNIASGTRLNTSDGTGSFLVNYNGSSLVLSNFSSANQVVTATYLGGTNNWSNAPRWSTNPLVPNNGNGGTNFNVALGSGSLTQDIAPSVIIEQLQMSGGTLTLTNPLSLNAGLQFSGGTITNGVLNVAGTSTQSAVMGATGLTVNNSGAYSLTQASGNAFSGTGTLFNNSGTIARSTGMSGVTFNTSVNNTGILRASNGATLILTGAGGVLYNNAGGTISALDGSIVQLAAGASVTGGTLSTVGTGVIQANSSNNSSIFLTDLTNAGALIEINDSDITLAGTITNSGSITTATTTSVTDLILGAGGVTLTGGGTVNLSSGNDGLRAATAGDRLTNVNNLIRGQGLLGQDSAAISNQTAGIIDADVGGASLTLDPGNEANAFLNDGILRASNGGTLILSGNGGGVFTNNNLITALNGSIVQLTAGASVVGGTLSTAGTGVVQANSGNNTSIFLTDLTNAGTLVGINDSDITLAGTITNSGSITTASTTTVTDIIIAAGGVTLNGGGTVTFSTSNDGIKAAVNGARLTNVNNLMRGLGLLGQDSTAITNQASGIIDANVNATSLTLDPANVTNAFINDGILRASNGGTLILSGNGGGVFNNNNLITALTGSVVQLTAEASIVGGTLSTAGTGVFQANSSDNTSIFLTDLTNAGTLVGINDSDITLAGTITNSGSITSASTSSVTDIIVAAGGVTLTGGGTVTLSTSNDGIRAAAAGAQLTNVNNLIQGQGLLGQDSTAITNQASGIIDANVNAASLTLDPANVANAFVNDGILRASNGGTLILSGNGGGVFSNHNLVTALDGSVVQLTAGASLVGGTLSTTGSGVIQANSAANTSVFLTDLTNTGALAAINDSDLTLAGTITNSGSITSATTSTVSDIVIAAGGVTLTGGGTLTLSTSNDGIRAAATGARLTNVNNLIQGQGLFGQNNTAFTNQAAGIVDANVNGATLTLDPVTEASVTDGGASFLNNGLLRASNGGILLLSGASGGAFTNSGTIAATTGGVLRFNGTVNSSGTVDVGANSLTATGTYTQSAGSFLLAGGTVQSNNALSFQGGLIDARGTITAAIQNNAMLRPALGGSGLNVTGNISLLSASNLVFQLGGLTQGTQYGFLNVTGNVSLGGSLNVSLVSNFQPSSATNFTVLSSTAPLTGTFANVASAGSLTTTNNSGSFTVTYSGNSVVLSNYTPASPRPGAQSPVSAVGAEDNVSASSDAALPSSRNRLASARPLLGEQSPAQAGGKMEARTFKFENTNQILDLLEGAEPQNAKGKIVIDAQRAAKSAGGRGGANANRVAIDADGKIKVAREGGRVGDAKAVPPETVKLTPSARSAN